MLQNEMNRATKKITDTKKKTHEIRHIKDQNDQKYLRKLERQRLAQ